MWRLVVGLAYVVGGFYLVFHPALGLATLTLWLASIFVVEGAMRIAFFFAIRAQPGAVWSLVDGIVTLLLGFLVFRDWPADSQWVVGTLLGVSLLMSGFSGLMHSLAARQFLKTAPGA